MSHLLPFPIRQECPPGACVCGRDELLDAWEREPQTDIRVLCLTREQERDLLAHIEAIATYAELNRLEQRLQENLGVVLRIVPSARGVRTVHGLSIKLDDRPGLCRRTRENVPAAIRRCLAQKPEIVYALLNARDLLGEDS